MNIKQLTYPTSTLISLAEAKLQLRVTGTEEDMLIDRCIKSATNFIEKQTGQTLQNVTFCAYLDTCEVQAFGTIEIWKYPITEITSIKYLNSSGVETTLDPSSYSTDITDTPARIFFNTVPVTQINVLNTYRVYFSAGFTNSDEIDQTLLDWVRKFTADNFNMRQVGYTGTSLDSIDWSKYLDMYRKEPII
jgi:uncharacterized phiE125 gp8 family phage protein